MHPQMPRRSPIFCFFNQFFLRTMKTVFDEFSKEVHLENSPWYLEFVMCFTTEAGVEAGSKLQQEEDYGILGNINFHRQAQNTYEFSVSCVYI